MVVTEMPAPAPAAGTEVELFHLRCRIAPPPRFLYCPNPESSNSNKYRFCRADLGGTDGVEMLVVSAWYTTAPVGKGVKALRRVAHHASRVIHQSQQLYHIRIECQEINLQQAFRNRNSGSRRWFTGKRCMNQDAVIAVVDCVDAQGTKKQNTVGFIRDSSTGQVYLLRS
ncbi:MAG: hypothetical protein SGARI_005913 [Bacillariaceae sp.]